MLDRLPLDIFLGDPDMLVRAFSWLVLGLLACSLAGCGMTNTRLKIAELQGKVTLQGKAVDRVMLTFISVDNPKGEGELCAVEQGSYSIKILSGKYKVIVEPAPGGTSVPSLYRRFETTTLEVDATSSRAIEKNLELR